MNAAPYPPPLGIAELVRQHGDHWLYAGIMYADRIHDDRLHSAYLSLQQPNSSDCHDAMKMYFYTKRIYGRPINEIRGRA